MFSDKQRTWNVRMIPSSGSRPVRHYLTCHKDRQLWSPILTLREMLNLFPRRRPKLHFKSVSVRNLHFINSSLHTLFPMRVLGKVSFVPPWFECIFGCRIHLDTMKYYCYSFIQSYLTIKWHSRRVFCGCANKPQSYSSLFCRHRRLQTLLKTQIATAPLLMSSSKSGSAVLNTGMEAGSITAAPPNVDE